MRSVIKLALACFLFSAMVSLSLGMVGVPVLWAGVAAVAVTIILLLAGVVYYEGTQPVAVPPSLLRPAPPTAPAVIEYGRPFTLHSSGGTEIVITPALQCPDDCRVEGLRCQGPVGHGGQHWVYTGAGWLIRWAEDHGSSSTPPGHIWYVHPKDLVHLYYRAFYKQEVRPTAEQQWGE